MGLNFGLTGNMFQPSAEDGQVLTKEGSRETWDNVNTTAMNMIATTAGHGAQQNKGVGAFATLTGGTITKNITGAHLALIFWSGQVWDATAGSVIDIYLYIDGAQMTGMERSPTCGANHYQHTNFFTAQSMTTGNHTYEIKWTTSAGTAYCDIHNFMIVFFKT